MASESTNGGTVSVGLPEDLDAWLDERAEELGLEREDLFQRLLAAYQVAATTGEEEFDPLGDTGALDERLDRIEREYQDGLNDVRKRVLQLKRVTDEKADADHDHEALNRVDEFEDRIASLERRLDEFEDRLVTLANREAAGGTVGRDELEDVQQKLSRVARAVVALRQASADAEAERTADAVSSDEAGEGDTSEEPDSEAEPEPEPTPDERESSAAAAQDSTSTPASDAGSQAAVGPEPAVDADAAERLLDIKRTAAREGYERARCGACGESSHVNLLPEPACPACGTPFYDLVEKGGLRKKPTLVGEGGSE